MREITHLSSRLLQLPRHESIAVPLRHLHHAEALWRDGVVLSRHLVTCAADHQHSQHLFQRLQQAQRQWQHHAVSAPQKLVNTL